MRSRRRFGGALEPATQVLAHYTERPREDLVRMDSFEIVWSPLTAPVDALRAAGMQLVVEVVEEAMPELAVEDNVFRLAVAALRGMGEQGSAAIQNAGLSATRPAPQGAPVEMTQHGGLVEAREFEPGGSVWVGVTYF